MSKRRTDHLKLVLAPLWGLCIALFGNFIHWALPLSFASMVLIFLYNYRKMEALVICPKCNARLDSLPGGWRVPFLLKSCRKCGWLVK